MICSFFESVNNLYIRTQNETHLTRPYIYTHKHICKPPSSFVYLVHLLELAHYDLYRNFGQHRTITFLVSYRIHVIFLPTYMDHDTLRSEYIRSRRISSSKASHIVHGRRHSKFWFALTVVSGLPNQGLPNLSNKLVLSVECHPPQHHCFIQLSCNECR